MEFIADLHIHSHYSRATSKFCNPENLCLWAGYKGISLLGTGDFTHPKWREELKEKLEPAEPGFYRAKKNYMNGLQGGFHPSCSEVRFVLSGEISSIYKKNGKTRKIHNVILLPSFEAADALSSRLDAIGNIRSDGRPILGLDSRELLAITLECASNAIFIPAHIWTPHFSLFGANSGFDTIEECFEDLTPYIYALETGLSSDPPMNWRLSALDRFNLVSNSDAHSPGNLAREANIFETDLSYEAIYNALKHKDDKGFAGTIEFYPEEGKYHFDGHRNCGISWNPAETKKAGGICPVCGKKITVGVYHRVDELADREEGFLPPDAKRYENLVALDTIIGSAIGVGSSSKKVQQLYFKLIDALGPELNILRQIALSDIASVAGGIIAEGVKRVREGQIHISPGFDGEYGKIEVFTEDEKKNLRGR